MPVRNLTFEQMTPELSQTLLLSTYIRNEMEEIHQFISDELMAMLNAQIRYSIYEFLTEVVHDNSHLDFLVKTIAGYWEVPGIDPKPVFTGEELFDGKPFTKDDLLRLRGRQIADIESDAGQYAIERG